MTEQTERPLAELVRELAFWRRDRAVVQDIYDEGFAQFQEQHKPDLAYLAQSKDAIASLEAQIRSRGAALAAEQGKDFEPVPGTKAPMKDDG